MEHDRLCHRCGTLLLDGVGGRCGKCGAPLPVLRPITIGSGETPAMERRHSARLSRLPTLPEPRGRFDGPVRHRRLGPNDGNDDPDYELTSLIGEGGMGVVWAAKQVGLGREVALKRARPGQDVIRTSEIILAEAVLAGSLEHPGIVPVHEVGIDQDGLPFYSMRRLFGQTWIERWSEMTQREHLEVLLRVADAVAYAHDRGVIHRDIKPDNVFLGRYGEVILLDWGLAVRTADIATGNVRATAAGTPAYMAPEMARAQLSRIGPGSDIYLLGGILYEILTDEAPHPGEDATQVLIAAAENRFTRELPAGELGEVVRIALATGADQRFADVPSFQRAVRICLDHQESISLANRAQTRLEEAGINSDHDGFARAVHGLEDALAQWPGNRLAAELLSTARLAYASHARMSGDLKLALTLLDRDDPLHRQERAAISAQQRSQVRRRRLLLALAWSTGTLFLAVLVAISAAYLMAKHQHDLIVDITRERDAMESALVQAGRGHGWQRIMQEDFASGAMPSGMRATAGRWEISANELVATGEGRSALVMSLPSSGDAHLQLDVHAGGEVALRLRCPASGVMDDLAGLSVILGERLTVLVAGRQVASERLPEPAIALPRRLRLELVTDQLRVVVDGHVVIGLLAVDLPHGGDQIAGIRARSGSRIDNLRVEVPEAGP